MRRRASLSASRHPLCGCYRSDLPDAPHGTRCDGRDPADAWSSNGRHPFLALMTWYSPSPKLPPTTTIGISLGMYSSGNAGPVVFVDDHARRPDRQTHAHREPLTESMSDLVQRNNIEQEPTFTGGGLHPMVRSWTWRRRKDWPRTPPRSPSSWFDRERAPQCSACSPAP